MTDRDGQRGTPCLLPPHTTMRLTCPPHILLFPSPYPLFHPLFPFFSTPSFFFLFNPRLPPPPSAFFAPFPSILSHSSPAPFSFSSTSSSSLSFSPTPPSVFFSLSPLLIVSHYRLSSHLLVPFAFFSSLCTLISYFLFVLHYKSYFFCYLLKDELNVCKDGKKYK